MSWQTTRLVEFSHVDAAGMVFYPRYFEMINSIIEEFFASHMDYPFAPMHFTDQRGVPTARVSVEFLAPSRLGDVLTFTLNIVRLGNSSVTLDILCSGAGGERFRADQVLVLMDLKTAKSVPWPDNLRQKFETA